MSGLNKKGWTGLRLCIQKLQLTVTDVLMAGWQQSKNQFKIHVMTVHSCTND